MPKGGFIPTNITIWIITDANVTICNRYFICLGVLGFSFAEL
jgi:hypothetical protein